jgi:hypothetical protein
MRSLIQFSFRAFLPGLTSLLMVLSVLSFTAPVVGQNADGARYVVPDNLQQLGPAEFSTRSIPLNIFSKNASLDVANGGFEDHPDSLVGWTVSDAGSGAWYVQTGMLSPTNGFSVAAPPDSLQAAMTDQGGPGTHFLYQNLDLVDGPAEITLDFMLFVQNLGAAWVVPDPDTLDHTVVPNQQIRVDIMDPTSDSTAVSAGVLMNLFSVEPGVTPDSLGYMTISADLSPLAGQTIRLRFAEVDNLGFLHMGVDSVFLTQTLLPPVAPTLLTPLNGAIDVPMMVDLRWTPSPSATRYNVEVATDSELNDKILQENVPGDQYAFTAPTGGTTYWWRINAEGPGGTSPYSEVFHYTTINLVPDAPLLISPADGAVDQPNDLQLQWSGVQNADRYDVQVFSDSAHTVEVFKDNTPTTMSRFVAPMAGHTYFWRVQSFGQGGSAASGFSSFTTSASGGSLVPTGLSPEDGATGIPVDPFMAWVASDSATSYHLQIGTNETFAEIVVDEDSIDGISFQAMGLEHETEYCWRVAGVDAAGNSTFSPSQTFTTVIAAPGAVQLASPADEAGGVQAFAEFSWESIDGVDAYELHVSASADFASPIIADSSLTETAYVPADPFAYNTVHYWRVRAMNAGGWGEWSETRSFTTATGVATESDDLPVEFSLGQNYPNPFNPSTRIEYALPKSAQVRITIFDALGRPVAELVNQQRSAGYHTAVWDGAGFVSGIYFYRIDAGDFVESRQMTLLK